MKRYRKMNSHQAIGNRPVQCQRKQRNSAEMQAMWYSAGVNPPTVSKGIALWGLGEPKGKTMQCRLKSTGKFLIVEDFRRLSNFIKFLYSLCPAK